MRQTSTPSGKVYVSDDPSISPAPAKVPTWPYLWKEFNRYGGKHGKVDAKYVSLLNALAGLRLKARYPDAPLSVAPSVAHEWFQIAAAMLDDVASRPAFRFEPEFVERPIWQGRK